MSFLTFLLKFYGFEFHYKYFRYVYRQSVLLSNKFGIIPMLLSLFKPLFGTPGFFSRIQGLVIRSLVIVIGGSIVLAFLTSMLFIYAATIYSIIISFVKLPSVVFVLLILFVLYAMIRYVYYPISPIKDYLNFNQYLESGDYNQRNLVRLIASRNYLGALKILFSNKFILDFIKRSELEEKSLYKFLSSEEIKKINPEEYFKVLLDINNVLRFRHIKDEMFLVAFLKILDPESKYLSTYSCDIGEMISNVQMVSYYFNNHEYSIFDDDFKLPPSGGFDRDWAVGYTSILNRSGIDLTKMSLKGLMPKLIGRSDVRDQVISILRKKSRNNVMLVGEPGCGKTTFVQALANEIATGTSIPELRYKRIISIDLGALTSGNMGDVNSRLTQLIKEIETSNNIILFVDEIHNLSSNINSDPNATSVFAILEPHLASGKFQFIGATSRSNYNKYIAPNGSFAKAFDLVEMREATKDETLNIMVNNLKKIEKDLQVTVTYPAYYATFEFAQRFVHNRSFPDSAVELLNQIISQHSSQKVISSLITDADVATYVSKSFKVPVDSIQKSEREKLLSLEDVLHTRVIGQDSAIKYVSNALKRSRVGVRDESKPIASFLFAGPTGVGKTETAKAISDIYFGSDKFMIRIDMSEYNDPLSINRLIGDSRNSGILTSSVKDTPFSLILLDEIEKADKNVLNLFLQVLDDGRLTDSTGNTVSFSNTIIIMTTNVGTREIIDAINLKKDSTQVHDVTIEALKRHFQPEFLNRFTALVPYSPLTFENTTQIARLKLKKLADRMSEKHIYINFSEKCIEETAKEGYVPEWGARPINRVIEDNLETYIADSIIKGNIKTGDKLELETLWMSKLEQKG